MADIYHIAAHVFAAHDISERYEFTLAGDAPASTRRLGALRAIPLTASSELRASADLRRLSDQLISRYPQLEWYEVLCQPAVPSHEPEAEEIPAVALLDRRLPILICLYDASAFFSVDAELTRSTARRAFRSAASYVGFLRDCGYAVLVDHEAGTAGPVPADLSSMTSRLILTGRYRWFGRLQFDSAAWFFVGSIAFVLLALAYGGGAQRQSRSLAEVLSLGGLVGAALAAFHYVYERDQLRDRLREMRDTIVTPAETTAPVRFDVPPVWSDIVATIGVLGGFALMGSLSGGRLVPVFLAAATVVAVTYLLLCRRAYVVISTGGIEGLGLSGRRFLPFEEVDGVEQHAALESWTVTSAARGTLWVPRKLVGREQLVEVLTERVQASWKPAVGQRAQDDDALSASVEEALKRARRDRWFGSAFGRRSRRPLWLWLMRHHPLRAQYAWTRHLLTSGQVRIAHVVSPPYQLRSLQDDWTESTHALLLVLAEGQAWQGGPALCAAIEAMAAPDDPPGINDVEQFSVALERNAGFPLLLRVPSSLVDGTAVYCTSTLVSRRDIPLGWLRSRWLPVLIDPQACPFTIVVPLRYWGPFVRRSWKDTAQA